MLIIEFINLVSFLIQAEQYDSIILLNLDYLKYIAICYFKFILISCYLIQLNF